ncbi:MAG: tRNA (guanosine(46)-N7)-methyltransferase TrmB, partial [Cyclobacteriaceae bacterium]
KPLFEEIKGNWNKKQFQKEGPLIVELACGRGEFTVGLARIYPRKNFIGVDIKGSRIWKGSSIALDEGLINVAFLRTQIQLLEASFGEKEIDELWITFPDPRPKDRDERRRLTSPRFLNIFKNLMVKRGLIHIKTDNTGLYAYTMDLLLSRKDVKIWKHTENFYSSEWKDDHYGIKTKYETLFMEKGETIKYIQFSFI